MILKLKKMNNKNKVIHLITIILNQVVIKITTPIQILLNKKIQNNNLRINNFNKLKNKLL